MFRGVRNVKVTSLGSIGTSKTGTMLSIIRAPTQKNICLIIDLETSYTNYRIGELYENHPTIRRTTSDAHTTLDPRRPLVIHHCRSASHYHSTPPSHTALSGLVIIHDRTSSDSSCKSSGPLELGNACFCCMSHFSDLRCDFATMRCYGVGACDADW